MGIVSLLTHSFLDGYNNDATRIFGGGLERYVFDLCKVIQAMGHQPIVHQLSYFQSFQTEFSGIQVHGHPYDFENIPAAFDSMKGQAAGKLIYTSCIWQPLSYQPGSMAICHGINWDRPSLSLDAKRRISAYVQQAIDSLSKIVTVDSQFLTYCRSVCYFEDPNLFQLIPNAVDTSYFTPETMPFPGTAATDDRPLRVLFPRRISLERGVIVMMLVADRLLAAYPRVEVEFAGEVLEDSPVGRAFRIWHRNHPHRERIHQHTYSFETVRQAYRGADLAVIPSVYSEGTSLSCLEAMSCGLAVVASNVGGLNDLIIDGYNGLLTDPVEDKLFVAICRLLDDQAWRKTIGQRARETALAHDKSSWEQKWHGVIEEFLASET